MSVPGYEKRPFLVVSGMHRSHTSLLGRMLVDTGLRFHDELVEGNPTNPYGHYEDVDLLRFQRSILSEHGARWFRGIDRELTVTAARREEARKIVERRFDRLGDMWGFKVPDSTLFLNFWAEWDEARFILIFRHPRAVLSSMFRRMGHQFFYRPDAVIAMAKAYGVYNERILAHRQDFPERTYLMFSDDLLQNSEKVLHAAACKLGFQIKEGWVGKKLVDREIESAPSQLLERLASEILSRTPRIQAVFTELCAAADSRFVR